MTSRATLPSRRWEEGCRLRRHDPLSAQAIPPAVADECEHTHAVDLVAPVRIDMEAVPCVQPAAPYPSQLGDPGCVERNDWFVAHALDLRVR